MTIFVDASALVAIVAGETGADELAARLTEHDKRITSPIARWEAIVALHRSHEYDWSYAQQSIDDFLAIQAIENVAIGPAEGQRALNAYANYGKGKHKAALNMGDCFAYACAKANDAQLLYIGDDFVHTDLS